MGERQSLIFFSKATLLIKAASALDLAFLDQFLFCPCLCRFALLDPLSAAEANRRCDAWHQLTSSWV